MSIRMVGTYVVNSLLHPLTTMFFLFHIFIKRTLRVTCAGLMRWA